MIITDEMSQEGRSLDVTAATDIEMTGTEKWTEIGQEIGRGGTTTGKMTDEAVILLLLRVSQAYSLAPSILM